MGTSTTVPPAPQPWPDRALLCRPGIGQPLEVVDPTLEEVSAEEIAARPDMYCEYEQVED